jgi:hypothetical protein
MEASIVSHSPDHWPVLCAQHRCFYVVATEPPATWQALCINNLFHSLGLLTFLQEVFGVHTAYGRDDHAQAGQAITIFRAPPPLLTRLWGCPVGGSIQSGL